MSFNSQKAPHTSPLQASNGVSLVNITEKTDHININTGLDSARIKLRKHPTTWTQEHTDWEVVFFNLFVAFTQFFFNG